jgi:hypothetical protein
VSETLVYYLHPAAGHIFLNSTFDRWDVVIAELESLTDAKVMADVVLAAVTV